MTSKPFWAQESDVRNRRPGNEPDRPPRLPSLVIVPDVRSYGRRADDKLGGDLISLERPVATQALLPSFS